MIYREYLFLKIIKYGNIFINDFIINLYVLENNILLKFVKKIFFNN